VLALRLGSLAVLAAAWLAWQLVGRSQAPPEVTPLAAPKLKLLPEFQDAAYKSRMLWGSYRSGLYFGMRTRWVMAGPGSCTQGPGRAPAPCCRPCRSVRSTQVRHATPHPPTRTASRLPAGRPSRCSWG
jgi:hypothetical protein